MSIVVDNLVEKAVDAAVDGLVEQIGYFLEYDNNIDCLTEKLKDLKEANEKVEQQVEAARGSLQEIYSVVLTWMSHAEAEIGAAGKILEEDAKADKTCCCAWSRLPNFKNCYLSSKNAKLKAPEIAELAKKGLEFDQVGYHAPWQQMLHTDGDYNAFESRESTVMSIMEALRNKEDDLIGVWGLGGVGKTTLAKEVAHQMKDEGIFKLVIMAEVHPKPDIKTIQERVAEWVQIKKEVKSLDSVELRAALLHKRLLQENSLLVILDDVWDAIDLKKFGIPIGGGHESRCTVLVTTRHEAVISQMAVKKKKHFQLNVLRDDEAWKLFQNTVGDIPEDARGLATEIVTRCGGLPILLLPVATALKDKQLHVWQDALQLLILGLQKRGDDMQALAYAALELSCKHLSEEQKSMFLFCGLLKTQRIDIMDAVKYTAGLRLFKDCATIKATRSRVLKLLGDLKSSCLLLKGDDHDSFYTMHDVVHGFARQYSDHVFSPMDYSVVEEWPDKHELEELTHISLRYCQLSDLPTRLECPKLQVFLFYQPPSTPGDIFFDAIEDLRVLDLSNVRLSPLPSSLQRLQSLQTLCLDRCMVEDVAMIGNMSQLKILSLIGANIVDLPKEIGKLARLQLLDLRRCMELKKISPGILSSLAHLEELYMGDSFTQWGLRGKCDGQQINADLAELKKLKKLTALEIGVTDVMSLPDDLFSEKLERFFIVIGDCWDWSRNDDVSATLKVKLDSRIRVLKKVNVLLKKADDLHLDNSVGVKDADLLELNMEGFGNRLINLQLQNFHAVQYLVNTVERGPSIAFPRLEVLVIDNARHLEKICNGPLKKESLGNLKQIKISNCDALSYVFPLSVATYLSKLEDIEVTFCEKMEGIFIMDDKGAPADKDENIYLGCLRKLTLDHLPRLENILSSMTGQETTEGAFFNEKIVFPNIEDLKACSLKICKIWDNEVSNSYACVRNLISLKIDGCKFIKYIFTVSMVNSLAELKRLEIRNCVLLEEIIFSEKHGHANRICHPKLEFLYLKQLNSLRTVCTADLIECPNLKILWMDDCPELKTFITSSRQPCKSLFDNKVLFPSLEEIRVSNMDSLRMLWDEELHEDSFSKLKILRVEKAKSLSKLFSSTMLRKFHTLQKLKLDECDSLEEVFHLHDLISERGKYPERICMLTEVMAYHLPHLKHVWHGDPHGILSFQNLSILDFWDCSRMENLIPASVSQRLPLLEKLKLSDCSILEQIISKEERNQHQDAEATFAFPSLKQIRLWNVPSLSSFYPGEHIIDWPALQQVSIIRCSRLEVFKSEAQLGHQSSLSQPLFSFEQVVAKLESVSLSNQELRMIQKRELSDVVSSTLKVVELYGFGGESPKLPIKFLERFPNLEKLEVSLSDFVELFTYEFPDEEKATMTLSRIQHLDLQNLDKLEHIWNPQSKLDRILNNLKSLLICWCDCMIHLAPPSASLRNLTTLEVGRCESLVSLFTFSTMTSLVQLREMKVYNCDKLTEIITDSDEKIEGEAQICLYKLQILILFDLGSITSFCSQNNLTFKFPLLVDLLVKDCPQMEFFSSGYLSAPKLKTVWLTRNKDSSWWKGDLNTTIHQLRTDTVVTKLDLSKQEFQMIQKQELSDVSSSTLKAVKFYGFDDESPNLLINFLKRFPNLEKLEVSLSDFVELFTCEILDEAKETTPFSQIQHLDLRNLPKLEHIWKPQSKLDRILNNLKSLLVGRCGCMIHLAPPSASLRNLTTLEVGWCKSLVSLFTFSTMTSLVQLREMKVYNCDRLTEIITDSDEKIEGEAQICLYKLQILKLSELGSITSFCSQNNLTLKFPLLEVLVVEDCPQMKFFSSGYLSAPKLKTVRLTWNRGSSLWKGDLNTTIHRLYTDKTNAIEWCGEAKVEAATNEEEEADFD